jgi:protein phosphatase
MVMFPSPRISFVSAFEPVRYAALTDVGVKRSHNQDACAAQPAVDAAGFEACGHVFVVADGMGGHAVGEKASAKTVRDIPFLYLKHVKEIGVVNALKRAFSETNAGIHAIGQDNPEFRGLGTTSTALIIRPEGAWVGHVGDSRAYRVRNGVAEQLTFDHSWVWEIARRQGVDPDELGDFKKNVIIRSLGPDPEVEVDVEGPHPVQPGDSFLLCSDGLTGSVTPQEIGAVVTALSPDDAARLLVHMANLRGGPDNITVLIVCVPTVAGTTPGKNPTQPGVLNKLTGGWSRIPWPFTALGVGSLLAVGSLVMRLNEVQGATLFFLLASIVILAGLIGLILHVKKDPEDVPAPVDDTPRTLNVFKRHDCMITPALCDKFAELETSLAAGMKEQNTQLDWDGYGKLVTATETASANKNDAVPGFRCRCEALLFLAEAWNKSRHKQEAFRPSWTSPTRE